MSRSYSNKKGLLGRRETAKTITESSGGIGSIKLRRMKGSLESEKLSNLKHLETCIQSFPLQGKVEQHLDVVPCVPQQQTHLLTSCMFSSSLQLQTGGSFFLFFFFIQICKMEQPDVINVNFGSRKTLIG